VLPEIFGDVELSCQRLKCGWHGKASTARLLRILPFNWVFFTDWMIFEATRLRPCDTWNLVKA
jgi:hypothetical protein